MRKNAGNQSVLMSFGELAWVLFLGVLLVYCSHISIFNDKLTQADSRIQEYETLLPPHEKLKKGLADEENIGKEWEGKYSILKNKHDNMVATIPSLKDQIDRKNRQYDVLLAQNKMYREKLRQHEADSVDKAGLLARIAQLDKELETCGMKDYVIRKELLGLKGSLGKVVFIMDRSGSMNDGGRWEKTCKTVETWLLYLPLQKNLWASIGWGSAPRV